jgi:hypothetical protein
MRKLILLTSVLLLAACAKKGPQDPDFLQSAPARGPVPESWYKLPEQGAATEAGSLDRLGHDVDNLFAAQARALPAPAAATDTTPPADHPADWVPWHLAVMSTDFALTTQGVFGALLAGGSADVAARWARRDAIPQAVRYTTPAHDRRASDLVIRGTATADDVKKQLEPVVRAALATGSIKNESRFRANLQNAADSFRLTAAQLNQLGTTPGRFPLSAFRLEVAFEADGQVTPVIGVGGTLKLRFDWIVPDKKQAVATTEAVQHTPLGDGLVQLVRGLGPDIDAAVASAAPVTQAGYKLAGVRVGVGLTASGTVGLVNGSASAMGSVIFGDNEEEGGCHDPDGDGDCHNHHGTAEIAAIPAVDDGGIPLLKAAPATGDLQLAARNGVAVVLKNPLAQNKPGDGVIFKIPHDRFRAGMRKAIGISSFFTKHAAAVKGDWVIKELSTEFDVSLTGTTGLVTLQGTGELELEFEHKGI